MARVVDSASSLAACGRVARLWPMVCQRETIEPGRAGGDWNRATPRGRIRSREWDSER